MRKKKNEKSGRNEEGLVFCSTLHSKNGGKFKNNIFYFQHREREQTKHFFQRKFVSELSERSKHTILTEKLL